MVREGEERGLRHRVDGLWRCESGHVEHVGGVGILGAGTREQQSLRSSPIVGEPLPAIGFEQLTVGRVTLSSDSQSQLRAELLGNVIGDGHVPAAHEHRGHRRHRRVQAAVQAPLQATHVGLCSSHVVLGREEQRDVDVHTLEDGFLDGQQTFGGAGDLDV